MSLASGQPFWPCSSSSLQSLMIAGPWHSRALDLQDEIFGAYPGRKSDGRYELSPILIICELIPLNEI